MPVSKLWNRFKTPFKTFIVIFLAIFQISFLMNFKTIGNNITGRSPNQIETVGGFEIDLSVNEPEVVDVDDDSETPSEGRVRLVRLGNGDVVNPEDIVPANFPPEDRIVEALKNFDQKANACLVKPAAVEQFLSANSAHQNAIAAVSSDPSQQNKNAVKKAAVGLADTLVNLGFLSSYRSSNSPVTNNDSSTELNGFTFGRSSGIAAPSTSSNSMSAVLLDKNKPEDLEQIGKCHLEIMKALPTNEAKKSHYETNIALAYQEAIAKATGGVWKTLSDSFLTIAAQADQSTDNQYTFRVLADVYSQAADKVNTGLARIQLLETQKATNPSYVATYESEINTIKTSINTELLYIGTMAKTNILKYPTVSPQEIQNSNALIDQVIGGWQAHLASPGEIVPYGTTTPLTVTRGVRNPREPLFLQPSQNLDPANSMLLYDDQQYSVTSPNGGTYRDLTNNSAQRITTTNPNGYTGSQVNGVPTYNPRTGTYTNPSTSYGTQQDFGTQTTLPYDDRLNTRATGLERVRNRPQTSN